MSDDWGRKFSKFGNDLAAGLKDTGKLLKNDIEKARGQVAEHSQQSEAERQAAQQRRWERANSPTWAAPAQAADTVGKRRANTAGAMPVASRKTWSATPPGAWAIRREMASDTTSRGARSASGCTPGMIRAPDPSTNTAPSPRTASVISGR